MRTLNYWKVVNASGYAVFKTKAQAKEWAALRTDTKGIYPYPCYKVGKALIPLQQPALPGAC